MDAFDEVGRFWVWWDEAQPRIVEGLQQASTRPATLEEVYARIRALGLAPLLIPANLPGARYLLTASAAGDASFRRLAATWKVMAPASEVFAFDEFQPAVPFPTFINSRFGLGAPVSELGLTFSAEWDPRTERATISVAGMPAAVSESKRTDAAKSLLRYGLGELAYECWLADIRVVTGQPNGGVPLQTFVRDFLRQAEERDRVHYRTDTYLARKGRKITIRLLAPIQPERHPFLDTRVSMSIEHESGLTHNDLDRVPEIFYELAEDHAIHVASVSFGTVRDLIFYIDATSPGADLVREWATKTGHSLDWDHDPAWVRALQLQQPSSDFQLLETSDRSTADAFGVTLR